MINDYFQTPQIQEYLRAAKKVSQGLYTPNLGMLSSRTGFDPTAAPDQEADDFVDLMIASHLENLVLGGEPEGEIFVNVSREEAQIIIATGLAIFLPD